MTKNTYLIKQNQKTALRYKKLIPKPCLNDLYSTFTDEEVYLYSSDTKNSICVVLALYSPAVEQFINQTNYDKYFVIYPSNKVYFSNFASFNMKALHSNKKYFPIAYDDLNTLKTSLYANLEKNNYLVYGTSFVMLNDWTKDYKKEYNYILKAFKYLLEHELMNINTNNKYSKYQYFNQYKSISKLLKYPTTNVLKGVLKGFPCVCVGAGGSLSKNIEYLKQVQDKVYIIACLNVLKPLLKAGIKPDLVTALDFNIKMAEFCDTYHDLTLVSDVSAYHKLDEHFKHNILCLSSIAYKKTLVKFLADLGVDTSDNDKIKTSFSVAFFNINLAEYMGAKEIILLGQDLATSDKTHIDGYVFNKAKDNTWNIPVKSWDKKGIVYTDSAFNTYREFLELRIEQSDLTFYNCTEGGSFIKGCIHIPFKEAYNRLGCDFKGKPIAKYSFKQKYANFDVFLKVLKGNIELVQQTLQDIDELKKTKNPMLVDKINKVKNDLMKDDFVFGIISEQRHCLYNLYQYLRKQRKTEKDVINEIFVLLTHIKNSLELFYSSFILDNVQSI
jgi:hypothetical protein